ncbi:hypothetical protein DPMN_022687 [Dreissena polymorpha]|uniref:Uncharacterized protein n=1 Tax=Dreissena polymorpha TaxID=45954 RepID=A0A9D4SBZ1_DREPO|nr:hypothetical protein DPMN_022687 [Dreissena polymorpha]
MMPVIKTHFCRHCKKHGLTKDIRKVPHITLDQIKPGISMRLIESLRKIQKAALRNIRKTAFMLTKPCVPTPCWNRAISVAICSTRQPISNIILHLPSWQIHLVTLVELSTV